jgi:hypothetical protein
MRFAIAASARVIAAMAAMAPVTAVTEQVHGDECHSKDNPDPVLCQPGHIQLHLGLSKDMM